ncbi:hypothetical protein ACHAQA_009911 [Verticillium albo-atrum]
MATTGREKSPEDWLSETASEPVTFLVGSMGRRFHIHSALITRISPVISTMLQAGMSESLTKTITWDDMGENIFARFAAFVYTMDYPGHPKEFEVLAALRGYGPPYQCPALQMRAYDGEPHMQPVSLLLFHSIWNEWLEEEERTPSSKGYGKAQAIKVFWAFHNLNEQNWGPRPWTGWEAPAGDDCADSPLDLHADMGVLADRYDIASLGALATGKMVRSLSTMNFVPGQIADLTRLFRGVYARTRDGNSMRLAIAGYAVCMWEEFCPSQDFQDFLAEEDDFRRDFDGFIEWRE